MAFPAAGLLASSDLLGVCTLWPEGAAGLAEAIGGLSVVRGAGLLVQVVWDELDFLGAGSMVGMGFPNLVCSL